MNKEKIITVFGATGAQGGSLVKAILADPSGQFSVRAVTRDVTSEKAKALAHLGVEVVVADLDHIESVKQVLTNAYGAYLVTNFWEHFSVDKEQQQAANFAEAAKATGVEHVIWSTLEDTRNWVPLSSDRMPTLQEKYKVPHFDGKGEADQYFRDKGVPTTFMRTSFYWENFIYFGMGPKLADDGKYHIYFPMNDKVLPSMAVEDIGKCAYGIFKEGKKLIGKTVAVTGEKLTGDEMANKFSAALKKDVVYTNISPEAYRNLGFPGADDLGNMFQFKRDFNDEFSGIRDIKFSRDLNPELQSFDTWLANYGSSIPLE
jgi:uncharacterized protein YbjT (DUF2867 family)